MINIEHLFENKLKNQKNEEKTNYRLINRSHEN